jgi:2-C-methyl-D-erythritol 2,4-cyclodiphosphate synthase
MAEADIGEYFPDNDTRYKDIDSRILLENVVALVKRKGYVIKNIDTIIIAQKPKLSQYKQKIRKSIADIINIGKEDIGLKAKTNEGLGELGSSKAIAAYAVALLSRKSKEK